MLASIAGDGVGVTVMGRRLPVIMTAGLGLCRAMLEVCLHASYWCQECGWSAAAARGIAHMECRLCSYCSAAAHARMGIEHTRLKWA